jgi:molybdopterin converting factor small subunit
MAVTVTIKFLGAVRQDMGRPGCELRLPDGAALNDLAAELQRLGLNPDSPELLITLNNHGWRQWPADRPVVDGDTVSIFPAISGG